MPLNLLFRVKAAAETHFAAMDSSPSTPRYPSDSACFTTKSIAFRSAPRRSTITNSVRFDVNQMSLSMSNSVAFGKYNGTLNTPRVIQFGGRYEF